MDFEELIGLLFTLYITGSIILGLVRRQRGADKPGAKKETKHKGAGAGLASPRRWSMVDLLDAELLEQRLREFAGESLQPVQDPATEQHPPEAALPVEAPPASAPPQAVNALGPEERAGLDWHEDDWEDLSDPAWISPSGAPRPSGAAQTPTLPPAVAAYIQAGRPWQGAFVVKELLGPPRALSGRHRGRL